MIPSQKWRAMIAVAFGPLIATLDSSAMNVTLPSISRYFHADMAQVEWVVVAYLLSVGALLLPFGRLGDLIGKRKIFSIGLISFTLSSLLCAVSKSIDQLVLFRVLQGIGGSIFISVAPALLVDAFPSTERGQAMGMMGTIVSVGLLAGAPLGGLLTSYFSWRWIFLINLPVGIVGFILSRSWIQSDAKSQYFRFDWIGSLLIIFCSLSFLLAMNQFTRAPLAWSVISFLFFLAALFGFSFFWIELKNPEGVFDFRIFKNPLILGGNIALFFHFTAFSVVFYLTPFYMMDVLHYAPQKAGIAMAAFCTALALTMPISGMISDKVGSSLIAPLGLAWVAVSYGVIQHVTRETSFLHLILKLSCIGVASGIFQAPNNSSLMGAASKAQVGTASALIATMRTFGLMCGVALATVIFLWRVEAHDGLSRHFSLHELSPELFLMGFKDTLWISIIGALIAMGFCLSRQKHV